MARERLGNEGKWLVGGGGVLSEGISGDMKAKLKRLDEIEGGADELWKIDTLIGWDV